MSGLPCPGITKAACFAYSLEMHSLHFVHSALRSTMNTEVPVFHISFHNRPVLLWFYLPLKHTRNSFLKCIFWQNWFPHELLLQVEPVPIKLEMFSLQWKITTSRVPSCVCLPPSLTNSYKQAHLQKHLGVSTPEGQRAEKMARSHKFPLFTLACTLTTKDMTVLNFRFKFSLTHSVY